MVKLAALAFLFILLLPAPQVGQQQSKRQPNRNNGQSQPQKASEQPSSTPIQQSQAQVDLTAQGEASRQKQERDAKEDEFKAAQLRQNWIIVYATIWIGVFAFFSFITGLVYAVVSVKTLRAVKQQANAAQTQAEASETSAKAAEISASAAQQTAEVALKSFITAERPEIYFKRTQLYPLEAGKRIRAMFVACNGGRVTAYKIVFDFNFCAPPRAIFALDKVLPWDEAVLDRLDIIPPEADMTVRPTFGFEPTEIDLIGLGNDVLSLYIYGRMRYEDGYGREYKMSFYRQYNPLEPLELMYASDSVKTKADHEAKAEAKRATQ